MLTPSTLNLNNFLRNKARYNKELKYLILNLRI